MFCKRCGSQMPDGAGFCGSCGTAVEQSARSQPPYASSGPPPKQSRLGLWVGIAIAALIMIAAGVTVPLVLRDKGGEGATSSTAGSTTGASRTTMTTGSSTGSSVVASSSTSTSSTTTTSAGPPGDSPGEWMEVRLPETPQGAYSLSVSDEALLVETNGDSGRGLYAYLPGADGYVALPVEGDAWYWADLDGNLAVWREGTEDPQAFDFVDTYVCAYLLPNGPKVEVARGALTMNYPQVAGGRVSWTEAEPSDFNPEEYWNHHIYVVEVNATGEPVGEPTEVVSSAPAYMLGDSAWFYSLSGTHLAWENATAHRMFDAGTYVTELGSEAEPQKVGNEAWQPSIGGNTLVFWENSLMAFDLATGKTWEIDPVGDYASAGPTYAVYYRSDQTGAVWNWDIVAKGYSGGYEQVLAETSLDPYFSATIATSAKRVAFILDDVVRLFEWQEPVQD